MGHNILYIFLTVCHSKKNLKATGLNYSLIKNLQFDGKSFPSWKDGNLGNMVSPGQLLSDPNFLSSSHELMAAFPVLIKYQLECLQWYFLFLFFQVMAHFLSSFANEKEHVSTMSATLQSLPCKPRFSQGYENLLFHLPGSKGQINSTGLVSYEAF